VRPPPRKDQRRTPPAATPLSGAPPAAPEIHDGNTRKLETGPERVAEVRRKLAAGATNRMIAEEYDCNMSTVSGFRARHGAKIAQLRAELVEAAQAEDGLWIAHRVDRLGALQDMVERVIVVAAECGNDQLPEMVRTAIAGLHEAAEQLGQLPSRTQVNVGTQVNYRLEGVDMEAL